MPVVHKIAAVYITDARYHDMTLYSLASLARSQTTPLALCIVQSGYSRPVPPALESMVKSRGHTLELINIEAAAPVTTPISVDVLEKYRHISATTFLKTRAIDAIASRFDYILYLDGDVLIFDDLEIERVVGFPETIAACLDLSSSTGIDDPEFFINCEGHGVSPSFFNAGVMLVNARRWLQTNVSARYTENLLRHRDQGCPYFNTCSPNDQCALNMTLGREMQRLPTVWNTQKSALHTSAWETASIRHYTGPRKFLPIRAWACDRREHALLWAISHEYDLPAPTGLYDFGLSYALNKIRRRKTVAQYERIIASIEQVSRLRRFTSSARRASLPPQPHRSTGNN